MIVVDRIGVRLPGQEDVGPVLERERAFGRRLLDWGIRGPRGVSLCRRGRSQQRRHKAKKQKSRRRAGQAPALPRRELSRLAAAKRPRLSGRPPETGSLRTLMYFS